MIGWLRRLSLSRQLVLMTVSISTLVLGIALAVQVVVDGAMYVRELDNNLASVAEMVANANTATLVFDDVPAAEENLAALSQNAVVVSVSIFDRDGDVFAEYVKRGRDPAATRRSAPRAEAPGNLGYLASVFRTGRLLRVERPISLDSEVIGRVVVLGELGQLEARREWYAVIFATMLAVFAGVSFVCAVLFQRAITEPIRSLAANMRRVSDDNDYSVRSEGAGDDELGTLIGVFNDMLDRIEDQNNALARHSDHLEEIVAQRTEELGHAKRDLEATVERLKGTTEVAEAASVAKSDFLARMSHEIRTPLNGVLGMLELVGQGDLSRSQKRNVETAVKSGKGLLQVINEILDFSKIEAGRLVLDHVEFGLWDTVEDALDLFAESAHAKGLELTCFIDDEVPERVVGDSVRLRQVLVNLVSNAVKFTRDGEVGVTVDVVRRSDTGANVRIRVNDTGPGIPPHLREHLFDAFAQADISVTRQFGGTGLGLAIARELTHGMGGEIGFETDRIRGSTFEFSVQLELPEPESRADPVQYPNLRGAHALIACGGKTLRSILERHMRSWQMHVEQLGNPSLIPAALPGVEDGMRDIALILDADSPRESMIEWMDRITDVLTDARLHVIVLVGPSGGHHEETTRIGRSLAKPVRKSDLATALAASFAGDPIEKESPASDEGTVPGSFDLRILLAEDNEVNQEVAVGMLESLGCRVDVVENGEGAIRQAAAGPYDLIFMDCQMPAIDGYQATLRIRCGEQASGGGRVPIVALTAHAEEGARDKCLGAGMDDYLAKPFSFAELAEVLGRWCDRPLSEVPRLPGAGATENVSAGALAQEVIEKLRGLPGRNGSDFLRRVLSAYLETSPDLMRKLQRAVAEDSAERIGDAAHSLKSCSENIGALGLASLCRELEQRARNKPAAGWTDLVQQIEGVFPLVLEATEAAIPREQVR